MANNIIRWTIEIESNKDESFSVKKGGFAIGVIKKHRSGEFMFSAWPVGLYSAETMKEISSALDEINESHGDYEGYA